VVVNLLRQENEVQGFFKHESANNFDMVLLNCGPNCNILGSESSERLMAQAANRVDTADNRAACNGTGTNGTESNPFFVCLGIRLGLFCLPLFGVIDITGGCEATCGLCKFNFASLKI
jgi:hypothetical protein